MVFGSWCGDSRRDVPRFYRILDELKFPDSKLAVVAVDRTKTANSKALKDLTIERVPTIFFYENNVLLGKIVETPEVSLEKDMLKIIQNSDRKWK
jgi:thiol-disulfide isomerase/thioredoxin